MVDILVHKNYVQFIECYPVAEEITWHWCKLSSGSFLHKVTSVLMQYKIAGIIPAILHSYLIVKS